MSAGAVGTRVREDETRNERSPGAGRGRWLRPLEEALLLFFAAALSLSIAATEIAFLSALAVRVMRAWRGEPLSFRPRAVAWTALALAGAWSLSALFSPEPASSLFRVHRLYQVLVVFLVSENAGRGLTPRLAIAYFAGAGLGAVYGLATWLPTLLAGEPGVRLAGGFSTAMTSGNVLATAFAAGVAVVLAARAAPRLWAAGATPAVALALAASGTRSSWLGALAGSGTALILAGRRSRRARVGVLIAIAVLAAATLWPGFRQRAASAFDPHDYTARGRVSLWRSGWDLFRERPLLGWGLADQSARIRAHRRPDATFAAGHFHSNLVQVAVTGGAIGLVAYAALMAALGFCLWKRRDSPWALAGLAAWVSFQVAGLFDWSFGDAEVAYQFFFWMGLGLADNVGTGSLLVDPSPGRLLA